MKEQLRRSRRITRLLATTAAIALLVAACGGNGDDEPVDQADESAEQDDSADQSDESAEGDDSAEQDESADGYPERDITVIVPFGAGGGTDNYVRQVAPHAAEELGINFQIQNVEGVAGLVGMRQLYEADPDGYTIGAYNPPATNIAEIAEGDDAGVSLAELTYIGSYGFGGWVMLVHEDLGADTMQDVIDLYQSGEITTLGSEHVGGPTQLIAELLKANDGLDYQEYVGYEGGEVGAAVQRQEIPVGIASDSAALAAVESGDVKVVATLYEPRSPFYPDVETAVEQGFSDISSVARLTRVVAGPPGMSDAVVQRLAEAFEAATLTDAVQDWSASTGSPVVWEGPEAATAAAVGAYDIQDQIDNLDELLGN